MSLMEDFNQIKQELQKKYKRAQVYSNLNSMPETARGNSFIVDALEPVIEVISKLDLNGHDSIEGLKEFSKRWQDASKELSNIGRYLEESGVGYYDDIWDNMSQVDKGITEFLKNFDLQETPDIEKETKTNEDKQKSFETVDLQHNMQKTDVEQNQDKIDQAIEEQRQATKESFVKTTDAQDKSIKNQISNNKEQKPQKNHLLNHEHSNQELITELQRVVNMFDRVHSQESFKNMMFALKELSEQNVVPKEMVDTYRHVFNEVKKHGNTERGIFDLSTEIYNQIAELKEQHDVVNNLKNHEKKPEEKKIEPKDNFRDEVKNVLDSHEDMFEKRNKVASFRAGIEKTKDLNNKRMEERMALFMKKKRFNNSWGE